MIEIADDTRDIIKKILSQNPGKCLRMVVNGNGCGGPYLGLYLDVAEPYEVITMVNGIEMLISDDVKKYAESTTINIFINHINQAHPGNVIKP